MDCGFLEKRILGCVLMAVRSVERGLVEGFLLVSRFLEIGQLDRLFLEVRHLECLLVESLVVAGRVVA